MHNGPSTVIRVEPEKGRRTIVVSDIHANLPYFQGLMKKVGFCAEDILVIDGDFLEKGEDSLGMLRYVMELCRGGNVITVCGNCDDLALVCTFTREFDQYALDYNRTKRSGLFWDILLDMGIQPDGDLDFDAIRPEILRRYAPEHAFLASLPHAVEYGRYLFAHAGADPEKPLRDHTVRQLARCDRFLTLGRRFDRWVVVGHWPVALYGENIVSAAPIIDRESHIISIDGGCVLKDDGQLNALIIPDAYADEFTTAAYDPFPTARVLSDQTGGGRSYYIRWGDSTVQVLERGEEFSRCRHVRTGYEMDILTKYLFSDGEITDCNDSTDYVLPLRAGDTVSIVERTSRGYFVKHDGVSGWYFGALEE